MSGFIFHDVQHLQHLQWALCVFSGVLGVGTFKRLASSASSARFMSKYFVLNEWSSLFRRSSSSFKSVTCRSRMFNSSDKSSNFVQNSFTTYQ